MGEHHKLLLAINAVAISVFGVVAGVDVSSFVGLEHAVRVGTSRILITSERIVFPSRLSIDAAYTELFIESTTPVPAILDGGGRTQLFSIHNNSKLSLRSLEIAFGGCEECFGGAIFVGPGSELRLSSVSLSSNRAKDAGAIFGVSSTIIAFDCTMTNNSASRFGGAVVTRSISIFTATNCSFTANSAAFGGAVYAEFEATVNATDCTMSSNSAHAGGAVYVLDGAAVALLGCTMSSNSASSSDIGWGGAVYAHGNSIFTATSSTVTSNYASVRGGAIAAFENATFAVSDCTMASNSAAFCGGAVDVGSWSKGTIRSSLLAWNHAEVRVNALNNCRFATGLMRVVRSAFRWPLAQ